MDEEYCFTLRGRSYWLVSEDRALMLRESVAHLQRVDVHEARSLVRAELHENPQRLRAHLEGCFSGLVAGLGRHTPQSMWEAYIDTKLLDDWMPSHGLYERAWATTQVRVPVQAPVAAWTPEPVTTSFDLTVFDVRSGAPIPGVALQVRDAGGTTHDLTTDSGGRVMVSSVPAGPCHVSTTLSASLSLEHTVMAASRAQGAAVSDGEEWEDAPDGKPWSLAAVTPHRVQAGDTLESIAADHGLSTDALLTFNFGGTSNDVVDEGLVWSVGCLERDPDTDRPTLTADADPGVIYIPAAFARDVAGEPGQLLPVRWAKPLVHRLHAEGWPIPDTPFRIELAGGEVRAGRTSRAGIVALAEYSRGPYAVSFPDTEDVLAKTLASEARAGFDGELLHPALGLLLMGQPAAGAAIDAYDRYFNTFTGNGFVEDVYHLVQDDDQLSLFEGLMGAANVGTRRQIGFVASDLVSHGDDQ